MTGALAVTFCCTAHVAQPAHLAHTLTIIAAQPSWRSLSYVLQPATYSTSHEASWLPGDGCASAATVPQLKWLCMLGALTVHAADAQPVHQAGTNTITAAQFVGAPWFDL